MRRVRNFINSRRNRAALKLSCIQSLFPVARRKCRTFLLFFFLRNNHWSYQNFNFKQSKAGCQLLKRWGLGKVWSPARRKAVLHAKCLFRRGYRNAAFAISRLHSETELWRSARNLFECAAWMRQELKNLLTVCNELPEVKFMNALRFRRSPNESRSLATRMKKKKKYFSAAAQKKEEAPPHITSHRRSRMRGTRVELAT